MTAERLCRRCRLPRVISDDHDPRCAWNARRRRPVLPPCFTPRADLDQDDVQELEELFRQCRR